MRDGLREAAAERLELQGDGDCHLGHPRPRLSSAFVTAVSEVGDRRGSRVPWLKPLGSHTDQDSSSISRPRSVLSWQRDLGGRINSPLMKCESKRPVVMQLWARQLVEELSPQLRLGGGTE